MPVSASKSIDATPALPPVVYPQLAGWLGALNKAAVTRSEPNVSPANTQVPQILANGSPLPSPPGAASPISGFLSQATSRQPLSEGIVSREAIYRQALDVATRALPQNDTPQGCRNKIKAKLRRALMRKFILRMVLGKDLAEWVYPWIHPKARSAGFSTM